MEDDPNVTPPIWAKALGILVLAALVIFALAVLVPLAMRLLIWAWAGVA
jgi:hypothetical protein